VRENVGWPVVDRPRRVGVSSFGISGTNAHLILEQAPEPDTSPENETGAGAGSETGSEREPDVSPGTEAFSEGAAGSERAAGSETGTGPAGRLVRPFVLSAVTPGALRDAAGRLAAHLDSHPDLTLGAVAHTLATRTAFAHRAVITAATHDDLRHDLHALTADQPTPNLVRGHAAQPLRTVFVFPGQGSQWAGMGVELLRESPVFRRRMQECADALAPHVGFSPLDVLRSGADVTAVGAVQ